MIKTYIRALSPRAEFVIVIAGAFGFFIITSVWSIFQPAASGQVHHSVASLVVLVISECVLTGILYWFLVLRGWTLQKVGLRLSFRDAATGIALALAAYLAWAVIWNLTAWLAPQLVVTMYRTGGKILPHSIPLAVSISVAIVNPVFEELFVAGYVITALERRSAWFAVNASVAIRLLYHLYQGVLGVLSMIPIGLIFAGWYVRSRKLWPLIIAHAIMDLTALLFYSRG